MVGRVPIMAKDTGEHKLTLEEIERELERLAYHLHRSKSDDEKTSEMIFNAWDHVCRAEEFVLKAKVSIEVNREDEIARLRENIVQTEEYLRIYQKDVRWAENRLRELKARLANMEGRRDDHP